MTKVNCPDKFQSLVPLSRAVAAAQIDTFSDRGKTQQQFSHWGCRIFDKLQQEVWKRGKQKAIIRVNQNTQTATLPSDFKQELFVGYIYKGLKYEIPLNSKLTNADSITDLSETCSVCNQKKAICNDLTVTEDVETVVINSAFYDKTTIKKLYPNGDYFLEVTTPYYNTDNSQVEYLTTKEFIVAIKLKPCGCVEETTENIQTIHDCCYDAWCCHFTPCSSTCDTKSGGYQIFEETGLIQFDFNFKHTVIYLEYIGSVPKVNGQLALPEVAFETVVEWIKWKAIQNKQSADRWRINDQWVSYRRERSNMEKMMSRISLARIIQSISVNPKFDFHTPFNCYSGIPNTIVVTSSTDVCDSSSSNSGSAGNTINNIINNLIISDTYTEIKLAVDGKTGSPVDSTNIYQNNALIGATNIAMINVNKGTEYKDDDYTFNGVSGTITRNNQWFTGDVGVLDFTRLGNGSLNVATALTDAATVAWDFSNGNVAHFTIGGNRALSISNAVNNSSGVLYVTQDGTGSRTLTFPTNSIFLNGWDGVIDTTAGKTIAVSFFYDGTNFRWQLG